MSKNKKKVTHSKKEEEQAKKVVKIEIGRAHV